MASLFGAARTGAAVEDFVISEVMYDAAGSDADKEWVEVFHNATTSVAITGGSTANSLRFYDGSNHTLAASSFQGSLTIEPQAYFILAQNAANFKSLYFGFTGTIIEVSAMSLGNALETIGFRTGSSGSLFSNFSYEKSWGGAGTGKSLEKKSLTGLSDSSNWVESSVDGGSPGVGYSAPAPSVSVYPSTVRINEFLPDPQSGDEWVELFNSDANQTATLTNWQLDDGEAGSTAQAFSVSIAPLSFYVVYFGSSKLNNDGDTVRLIRPDQVTSDSFNYSGTSKGVSFAFGGSTFVETKTPTPGAVNIFTSLKNKHKDVLKELKRLPLGSEIELDAWVTAPANLLGDKDFYVSDGEAGIRISYSVDPTFKIETDDRVTVASSLEESRDEKYIKTMAVSLVQKGARRIEERRILTGEATEALEGMLVKVEGNLVENSGETFYLDDGSGRVKVYRRESTGIVKIKMGLGDTLSVTGILSQYGFLQSGEANYRVLPRFQGDVVNKTESPKVRGATLGSSTKILKELPATGPSDLYILGWTLIFVGLSLRLKCLNDSAKGGSASGGK